jgi:hypothetical protein
MKPIPAPIAAPIAALLAFLALTLSAPAHATQDFGTCFASDTGSTGTVEAVREVTAPRDIHAFDPEVLEHKLRPETTEELIVRLDAGPLVVLKPRQRQRISAGERVRVGPDRTTLCRAPFAELAQRGF